MQADSCRYRDNIVPSCKPQGFEKSNIILPRMPQRLKESIFMLMSTTGPQEPEKWDRIPWQVSKGCRSYIIPHLHVKITLHDFRAEVVSSAMIDALALQLALQRMAWSENLVLPAGWALNIAKMIVIDLLRTLGYNLTFFCAPLEDST